MSANDTSIIGDEQHRIAKYLNINPERISDYLLVINALIDIEKRDGTAEMRNQISKMLGANDLF